MAWNPHAEGLLATGGGVDDQIIRIWDFKNGGSDVIHSIKCNSQITSLNWRKAKFT